MNSLNKTIHIILLVCCCCFFMAPPALNRIISSVKAQQQIKAVTPTASGHEVPMSIPGTNSTNNEEDQEDDESKVGLMEPPIPGYAQINTPSGFTVYQRFTLLHTYQEIIAPPPNSSLIV